MDRDGRPRLGISGPIWRQTNRAQQANAKALQTAARRLSAAFGAQGTAMSAKAH